MQIGLMKFLFQVNAIKILQTKFKCLISSELISGHATFLLVVANNSVFASRSNFNEDNIRTEP